VQLPGISDPQRAIDVVGTTAQMEIRLLPADLVPVPDPADPNNTLFRDKGGAGSVIPANVARQRSELIVSGRDVKPTTTVGFTDANDPAIFFELQGEGSRRFAEVTRRVANPNGIPGKDRFIPIFLDERVISAPRVESAITGGRGQISGGFKNIEEARELALLLNSGALPAPIDVVENRTVSATLGTDSLVKSLRAGMIGLMLVAIFMIAFYRLPGVLANFALIVYCVLNLAVFILIGGTLTLPGIAGFLLAIAMSLDTNILVFERLREEMRIQPTFAAALRAAFSRAWTAILDSHVTTLCAALVLFYFGTGPIKGFAITLGIGVLLSLFSAISVTRLFMWSVARWGEGSRTLFGSGISGSRELAPESK
jgi:preprotein translocase subunit SecD